MYRLLLISACVLGLAGTAAAQTRQAAPVQPSPPASQPAAPPQPMPATTPVRIRGTITAVAPDHLTIKSRDGSSVVVALRQPLTVMTVKRVPLSDIRDGTYVGIASRKGPHDTRVALEVLVFPEAMRGVGAGDYAWDLRPGSMMTNAPVTGVLKAKSGPDLTLTYAGGSVVIHVPARAPVVTLVAASSVDLKPRRRVFLVAQKAADGQLSAARITVATHGVNPPM